jgi:hypothetical protein
MNLLQLVEFARNKQNFPDLSAYISFARRFLDFADKQRNLQAVIVSRNETHYQFLQYRADGHFNITRPLNSRLMLKAKGSSTWTKEFLTAIDHAESLPSDDIGTRALICNAIYTMQQTIGASLDALPVGQSNKARKINGDLFERLIKLLIQRRGIDCMSGTVRVPVAAEGEEQFRMNYEHDLVIKTGEVVKVIGGVKTSSKDRLDKIFIDKFLYSRLTGTSVPHVAIVLNDVQRKGGPPRVGISGTFLPGRFKGYTVKLNPLDGVYYCDIRPNMQSDPMLRRHIRTIDHFFCTDLWGFVRTPTSLAERCEVLGALRTQCGTRGELGPSEPIPGEEVAFLGWSRTRRGARELL